MKAIRYILPAAILLLCSCTSKNGSRADQFDRGEGLDNDYYDALEEAEEKFSQEILDGYECPYCEEKDEEIAELQQEIEEYECEIEELHNAIDEIRATLVEAQIDFDMGNYDIGRSNLDDAELETY